MKRSVSCITTDRLWLRQIDETDAESIVSLRADKSVYKYFLNSVKITLDDHNNWYRNEYCFDENRMDWIAVDDINGSFIGVYGAKRIDSEMAEISYITSASMRGKGYATESIRAVMNWCSKNWGVNSFQVTIHNENTKSIEFAVKNGFVAENSDSTFVKMKKKGKMA